MITSIDSEKNFDRIQDPFMVKKKKKENKFQQIGFSGNIPQHSKGHI